MLHSTGTRELYGLGSISVGPTTQRSDRTTTLIRPGRSAQPNHRAGRSRSLTFVVNVDGAFTDNETGSTWSLLGRAIDGTLDGEQPNTGVHRNDFWFAWAAFHPDHAVYAGLGLSDREASAVALPGRSGVKELTIQPQHEAISRPLEIVVLQRRANSLRLTSSRNVMGPSGQRWITLFQETGPH